MLSNRLYALRCLEIKNCALSPLDQTNPRLRRIEMAAIGDNFVKLLPFVLAYFGLSLFHDWSWGLVECNVFVLVLLWAVSVWAGKIEELDWFAGRTASSPVSFCLRK